MDHSKKKKDHWKVFGPMAWGENEFLVSNLKSLWGVVWFFFHHFGCHPWIYPPFTCVDGGSAVSASAVPQGVISHIKQAPKRRPFLCCAQVTSGLYFCILICSWVCSSFFLRCRLVDSGEAKSFDKWSMKDEEAILFVSWDFPWTPKMDALEGSFLSST